jgi:hypothetical protein
MPPTAPIPAPVGDRGDFNKVMLELGFFKKAHSDEMEALRSEIRSLDSKKKQTPEDLSRIHQLETELKEIRVAQKKQEDEQIKLHRQHEAHEIALTQQKEDSTRNIEQNKKDIKQHVKDMARKHKILAEDMAREFAAKQAQIDAVNGQVGEHEGKFAQHKEAIEQVNTLAGHNDARLNDHDAKLENLNTRGDAAQHGIAALNGGMDGIYERSDQLLAHQQQQDRILDEGGGRVDRVVFERRYPWGADRRDDPQVQNEERFARLAAGLDGQTPLPVGGPGYPQQLGFQRPPRVQEMQLPPQAPQALIVGRGGGYYPNADSLPDEPPDKDESEFYY